MATTVILSLFCQNIGKNYHYSVLPLLEIGLKVHLLRIFATFSNAGFLPPSSQPHSGQPCLRRDAYEEEEIEHDMKSKNDEAENQIHNKIYSGQPWSRGDAYELNMIRRVKTMTQRTRFVKTKTIQTSTSSLQPEQRRWPSVHWSRSC